MANRYWVGGAGNWSSTTKWSASSGGASGASVPTSVDDAIFDANSGGKFTATVDTAQSVNSITITPSAAVGVQQIALSARLTTNNLTTTGTAGNNRIWIRGTTYGIAQDLVINGTVSISDCDFRDIYVVGTAAPISGTRIGDLRGCRGITFDAPKMVYWNLAAGGNWSANAWATTSGGAVSTDNFPLAQDTAVIGNTGLNTSATVTWDTAITYAGGIDMSSRINAMTLAFTTSRTVYGDWINGSGTTVSNTGGLTFSGRNTQTVTSAGKVMATSAGFSVDSYGGTVQLADALNLGSNNLVVTNGTFNTQNYNVTAGSLSSSNTNVRAINLGSSTVTLSTGSGVGFLGANFTFNAGTSTINLAGSAGPTISGGVTFYNVSVSALPSGGSLTLTGANTFNNLTVLAPVSASLGTISVQANQTITGTLTCAGASAVRRIFLRSDTLGTQRDLTVGTLVADDCDFRDIEILGAAIGTAPTRAGDCGGNNNITFPAPKTVYWNLTGSRSWSNAAWATSSGGTPDNNNFPLAQDTAIIENTGSPTTLVLQLFNVGTVDMSALTNAMAIGASTVPPTFYGDWTWAASVTFASGSTNSFTYSGRGVSTYTSAGINVPYSFTTDCVNGTLQLGDALSHAQGSVTVHLVSGTFDAGSYNVTTGRFSCSVAATAPATKTLKMGSGTWTLATTGAIGVVWDMNASTLTGGFYKGTADISLTDTSTTARTFNGGGLSYNKLTIGGTTGTSTLTINDNNQFTELASTKTVAHTIALGTTTQTFGAWTVTGTAGNVVTVTGTGTSHVIAGARVSGVDYLAMGTIGFAATSPGEFYAGANSTGTGANVIKTAAPAPVTRYWVGGTGTWDATTTTKWSATSGGAGGASVPTSADAVVFDSLSNATAYTVTCTATQLRCGSLTMAGPLVGNVTWAGSAPLAIHDNVSLAATGITASYSGTLTLSGSATGRTFTTNGQALSTPITVNGVGCGWTLGSALSATGVAITVINGTFDLATYNLTAGSLLSDYANTRTISLGSGTTSLSGSNGVLLGTTEANRANLTFTSGTSQINLTGATTNISGNNQTFYNVNATSTAVTTITVNGANTFNNFSVAGRTTAGVSAVQLSANQTINGTLTLSAGTNATMRTFVRSDTIGTTRTLTCAAVSATDADFRDIAIAGAAAPVSGTRLGDCKGNSGITFDAPKTVYFRLTGSGPYVWGGNAWAFTSSGALDYAAFPLAQDTVNFPSVQPASGGTVTVNATYNIGTIDMSARTSNTMTLATGSQTPAIYGNWINGTGTTLTGTSNVLFAGRSSQTITSAGVVFPQGLTIDVLSGSVTLQDAFTTSRPNVASLTLTSGTFDANGYNTTTFGVVTNNSNIRTLAIGAGTWTVTGSGSPWQGSPSTNLTVTGAGTISLTNASAKTFAGGGISYSGITLDQGGAGALTITGNNTFANISNSYKATGATNITLGTTTQTVGNFTASGEAGRVLTVQGTSASSPATLIFSGAGQATQPTTDYLAITGVRAYSLDTTWYAGANSTNNGSLGWYFEAGGGGPIAVYITESSTASDSSSSTATLNITVSESMTASEAAAAGMIFLGALSESATASDVAEAIKAYLASVSEATTASELAAASLTLTATLAELTTASESLAVQSILTAPVSEVLTAADSIVGGLLFLSDVTEAATASEIAESLLIFNRAISEATTASEVLVAVAAFQAAVPESVVGADVVRSLAQISSSVNEALTSLDAFVASNSITANIGALPQDIALLPVGTSAAGSLVFDSSSFIDGASVFANGTGSGSTGGFALGGNYLGFAYGGFAAYAEAISPAFSWTNVSGIRVDLIAGTGANGGPLPNGDMDVSLVLTVGPYQVYERLATITKDAADTLISVMIPVSAYYRVSSGKLSFQPNSTESTTTPEWAIKSFTIYYTGATVQESASSSRILRPAVSEALQIADFAQVVASTFSASSTEATNATEATQGANTGSSSLSESAGISESGSAKFVPSTSVSEQATAQESPSVAASTFGAATAETANVADVPSVAPSVFSAVAAAAASVFEVPNPAGSIYNAVLPVESAAAQDSLIGAYLWNIINDAQTPNWATVQTPQDPGWTTIDDTQNPGWHNINIT